MHCFIIVFCITNEHRCENVSSDNSKMPTGLDHKEFLAIFSNIIFKTSTITYRGTVLFLLSYKFITSCQLSVKQNADFADFARNTFSLLY